MNKPEFLAELPSDWTSVSTEDLLTDRKGAIKIGPFGSQLKKDYFVSDGYKVYGQENVFENDFTVGDRRINIARYLQLISCQLIPGDVVVSMMGTVGKCAVAPSEIETGIMDSHLLRLQVDEKKYDKGLLVQLISDSEIVKAQIKSLAVGGIMEGLSSTIIKRLEFPSPPLPEQRKIAQILSTVDNLIEKTQALIDKYQSIKQGMMHDLFTRGVDENGQLRPSYEEAPHLYKESELGWIPKEWEVTALSEFAQSPSAFVNGPFGSDLLTSELRDEGVPVIYIRDIKPGHYKRKSTTHVTDQKANQLSFCNVKKNDVLLAKVGDPPCDAAPYLEEERSIVTQDVIRIRPASEVDVYFLTYLINSTVGRRFIRRIIIEGTRARVSLTELKRTPFAKPTLAEQVIIGNRLKKLQDRISKEEDLVSKLLIIKTGLMQDLLTGKVRVKVDA